MDRFEDSFERLFARSYRVAFRIVGGSAEAEDVAAEALSRAYLAWWRLRDADHREAWVLRVTSNLAIDVLRKRTRVSHVEGDAPLHRAPSDLSAVLVPVLRKLPKRQREVVVLRHRPRLDDDVHRRVQSAHVTAATSTGWHVVYTRSIEPTYNAFTADVVQMRQLGVRTVYVVAIEWQQAAELAATMRQQKFMPDLFITDGEAALAPSDPGAEHAYVPSLVDPGGSGASVEYGLFRTWLAKVAPGTTPDDQAALAWAEGRLLFQAMEQAGPKASRHDVVRTLAALQSFSANGLVATTNPSAKPEHVHRHHEERRRSPHARGALEGLHLLRHAEEREVNGRHRTALASRAGTSRAGGI